MPRDPVFLNQTALASGASPDLRPLGMFALVRAG
jgi:hypothetical protein